MSELKPGAAKQVSPASVRGMSNLRTNPYVLVSAVGACILLFGTVFALVADRVASTAGLAVQESVVSGSEPTFDGEFADINPAAGPEIAPVPTSIATTPFPLDPVVTTVLTPNPTSPPTSKPPFRIEGSLTATDPSGRTLRLDLPANWSDTGGGLATFSGKPRMSVAVSSRTGGHESALSDYVEQLDESLADATFSATKSFSNSSYVAVGYLTYDGVEINPDGGPRKIFGFVWTGTSTVGTTWIIDWRSDAEASRSTINAYLTFFAERYLPTFSTN